MRYRTDDPVLWAFNRISWAELINTLDSNIGKAILEGSDKDQRLSLADMREKAEK
jgi:hypothetical protein